MTTGRKRWWRAAAIAAVGGVAVTGGWFGLVRAKGQPQPDAPLPEAANWTRSTAPVPTVAEVDRTPEPAPPTGPVTPVGATLPPIPMGGATGVAPAVPVAQPVIVPAVPLSVPVPPAVTPAIEPVTGPRIPDPALTGGDKSALPAVPSVPPADLPALPVPPKPTDAKPVVPLPDRAPPSPPVAPVGFPPVPSAPVAPVAPFGSGPAIPPLPMSTAEPPKAPPVPSGSSSAMPTVPPGPSGFPLPQPTPVAPPMPSAKPVDPMRPAQPVKPDSDLKPINPGNTLNPSVAPAVPVVPPGPGVPGRPVGLPKAPEPSFGASDKDVFPIKPVVPDPRVPHKRDDTMLNLTTTAAFAFLGGAMLAVEKANVPPAVPPVGAVPAPPSVPLKADADTEKLKRDLEAANKKIEELEKQVKRLTELLTGKKDELGLLVNPKEPGAVEDVKALKDKIAALEKELSTLKAQTVLKPAIVPDTKPKGVVKVVNEYPVEISMVINDKSYRVAPGTKLDVEVPAGDFTYQLLQSGAAATRSVIKDKETVTLRIK